MATLRQMKNGLRRRMGEPLQGTWGKFKYEERIGDQLYDELGESLNDAQIELARDIYTPESYPLIRYDSEIKIVSGQDVYTLERDFLGVEELRYIRGSQSYPMTRRSIKSVRRFYDRTYSGAILQYYDYQGLINTFIAEGVIDADSENTVLDTGGDFGSVRVGDVVHNITDDSQGIVKSFTSGRVVVDSLQGGRANVFMRGDSYGIATQEDTRYALQVYPKVTATDRMIYEGIPDPFMVSASDVVLANGIQAQFEALPDDYEEDEVIQFSLYEDGQLVENKFGPSEIGRDKLRVGWNTLDFMDSQYTFPIQFKENASYSLRATRSDNSEIDIAQIRLSTQRRDRMLNTYARLPRTMKTENSVCEMPSEFLEGVYVRGKIYLHDKLNPEGVSPQLWTEYKQYINDYKMHLALRDETGVVDIDTEGEYIDYVRDPKWTPYFGRRR